MTKINRLVLQGFKSFAKKTELVFEDKYNCVLGPNGSGKSNILDALCFVLGKSSSKSMRAEKSANLIYNGGKSKKPAKQACVEIYFDNTNGTFPLSNREIKISRTVGKEGTSKYKLNDNVTTRGEILELLSNGKINPDGYNIILQGDITMIIEKSPDERRKIVEEIASISVYEEKKQKAMHELNKVEDKLQEAAIVLAERKIYLQELKKERNQAIKFKELQEKINRNKGSLLNKKREIREKKKISLLARIQKQTEEISSIEKKIAEKKNKIKEKKEAIANINREIEEKGDKDQVQLQKQVEHLKVDIATQRTRIVSCRAEIDRVEERKSQLKKNLDEIEEKIKRLNLETKALKHAKKEKQELIEKIDKKIEKFKAQHKLGDTGNIESRIDEIDKEAEAEEREIHKLREEQQNLLREKDRLEYQIQNADEKIEKVLAVEIEHKNDLDKLKQIKIEFKKATLELNTSLNEDSSLAAQLGTARNKLLRLKENLAKSRAQQSRIQGKIAGGMAVQKILDKRKTNKGIFGLVSELGEVQSKYSLAIEVAAGSRIKSIVVDNDKTAAECIKFLKSSRLGTATFLPLNKLRVHETDSQLKDNADIPGLHGRAIDLVKFDPKFAAVFRYVLGSTVVVENIDFARRIGIGKMRMVTLDGDLAETSGAMRGGFRRRIPGLGFQEREVNQELEKLEKEEEDLENLITRLEGKKKASEAHIARLRELKANLEGDIVKIEKSLHLESDDLSMSKKLKKELKQKLKETSSSLSDVQKTITAQNKRVAALKMEKQKLRDKILALKNPTLIAELNTFEQKKTELKEEIIRITASIENIDNQIKNIMLPEKENTARILKQHQKEKKMFSREADNLEHSMKINEQELKEKEKNQKEFYKKFKNLFKKRDGFTQEMSKIEKKMYRLEENFRKAENTMNILSLEKAKISAELAGLLEEFSQYKGLKLYTDKPVEEMEKEVRQFESMVKNIGAVNMKALEIYEKVESEFQSIIEKKEKLTTEREDVLFMMNEIETKKRELFMETFEELNEQFKRIFVQLSAKGEAFLELEDPQTIFEGGLRLKVRITGNRFMDIRSLSGGEKTMTALAFLFAVQEFEPAYFYALDEVDAALDKRNSERLANLIRNYTQKAQYIVISHNDGVISEADNLYGISMDEHGVSKVVSLKV